MLTVKQTRSDYPNAARPEQEFGWVLLRTHNHPGETYPEMHVRMAKLGYAPTDGIMTEPYDSAESAIAHLRGHESLATVAYARIER